MVSSALDVYVALESIPKIISIADQMATKTIVGGGYPNKYRRLRGLGAYAGTEDARVAKTKEGIIEELRESYRQLPHSTVNEHSSGRKEEKSNKGEYP